MAHLTFGLHDDTLAFCLQRNDPVAMGKLTKANRGLYDIPNVEHSLKDGDYISVLLAVWSESDAKRRLSWLRDKAEQLHALLMYELALEEYKANPTLETLNTVSVPMIRAASMRILQDTKCIDDSSLMDAPKFMEEIYIKALRRTVDKKFYEEYENTQDIRLEAICSTLKRVANQSIKMTLPSPKWVAYHGLNQFWGEMKLHPETQWKILRDQVALEFLKKN